MTEESTTVPRTHNMDIQRLKSIIERHERLEEEKKALSSDQRDLMVEAKSAGFDVKIIREILRLRKMDPDDIRERDEMVDVYKHAIGME